MDPISPNNWRNCFHSDFFIIKRMNSQESYTSNDVKNGCLSKPWWILSVRTLMNFPLQLFLISS